MRRKPSREFTEEQEQAADEFISSASESPPSTDQANQKGAESENLEETTLPWKRPKVREDVKQTYPLRLPEPLHLKLKYISEKTGQSMNELCNEAVEKLVEEQLQEVL